MSLVGSFVLPGEVDARKHALATQVRAFDSVVQAHASAIDPGLVASWNGWRDASLAFLDKPTGFWTAGDENDQTIAYESEFNAWRKQIAPLAGTVTPPDVQPPAAPPDVGLDTGTKVLVGLGIAAVLVLALRR